MREVERLREIEAPADLSLRGSGAEEVAVDAQSEDGVSVHGRRAARTGAPLISFPGEERADGRGPRFLGAGRPQRDPVFRVAPAAHRLEALAHDRRAEARRLVETMRDRLLITEKYVLGKV